MYKQKYDPAKANEARKQEMEELSEKLEKGVKDIFSAENYKAYLDFCRKFPHYSINNQILIMMQRPDASLCQSYTAWKKVGRYVKKGEKAIRIMAPAPFKVQREREKLDSAGNIVRDSNGNVVKETVEVEMAAYKPVATFDVSQTFGDPIPEIEIDELSGNVVNYDQLFQALIEVSPVPIVFEEITNGAKGYYQTVEKKIAIKKGMSESHNIKTAVHEISHSMLHNIEQMKANKQRKSQEQKECEAESIAYIVCQHFGINTSDYSFPYLATWSSNQDIPELKQSLETITETASQLIDNIESKLVNW